MVKFCGLSLNLQANPRNDDGEFMKKATALVIFSDDFRAKDNPALFEACRNYEKVAAVYIYDENYQGRKIGSASKVFLHHVLNSFQEKLKKACDLELALRSGNVIAELKKITKEVKIDAIYFNKSYSKAQIATEAKIAKEFSDLEVKSFKSKLLFDPEQIKTGGGGSFKVFTPFAKACMKKSDEIGDFLPIKKAKSCQKIKSLKIEELGLLPKNEGDWHEKLIKNWDFDYDKLYKRIADFLENKVASYSDDRNMLAQDGNSRLSPYLRFGMVSPRVVFNAATNYENHQQFVTQILWREFAYHNSYYYPEVSTKEIHEKYSAFKWEHDEKDFSAWKKSETGFDVVDAGMKEIYATGIMHNRARMVVASFLIKHLLIDWRKGEQYFWDCLVDADYAINPFSWQWVFGSGFDAAPYFRVFNPELQQKRFDPKHEYCDKWLGREKLRPEKIVDHVTRRDLVLAKYKEIM